MIYSFGPFNLDTERFQLKNGDDVVDIEPQVFSVLLCLIENRDRVVTKDEFIDLIWEGRAVSDGTLSTRINAARRAVGDNGKADNCSSPRLRRNDVNCQFYYSVNS